MKPKSEPIHISYEIYQNLVNYLTVHASTDSWAKTCLDQLTSQAIAINEPKTKTDADIETDNVLPPTDIYQPLRNYLEKNQWEEADSCTKSLVTKGDLKTIDELWTKYSDGRFGFSIQSKIWKKLDGKEIGGTYNDYQFAGAESGDDAPDSHYDLRSTYKRFASHVGWNDTLSNSDIPSGHYPKRYTGNNRYASNNISVLCRYITKINEIHRGEKRKALIADQGVGKYGKSKFHSGQKVRFSMKSSRYDGCVGIVKLAINSVFVKVEFDDGYETIQDDRRFESIGSA